MPGDRYITMLPDIAIVDPVTDEPAIDEQGKPVLLSHVRILRLLCQAPAFGESVQASYSAHEILARCRSVGNSTHLRLAEEDWNLLVSAMSTKLSTLVRINPICLPQILPFLEAVKNAVKELPKPAEDAPANGVAAPQKLEAVQA